jgi:vacuolar-type H+-ATPase subunit I/STV1
MTAKGLTTHQQEEVKQVVFDDYIQRIPIQQTIDKIHEMMDVKLGENWICKLRARLKQSAKQEISKFREDRYAYVQKYLDRIHAVEQLEKKSWHILRRNEEEKKDDLITLKYIGELREIEILLVDLYNNLSRVANIGQHDYETIDPTNIQEEIKYSDDDRKF